MVAGAVENKRKSWSREVLWGLWGLVDELLGIFSKAWQQDTAK
jgi:hypothetical protein